MKLAILRTGESPADLLSRFGHYDDMFRDLLGPDFVMRTYNVRAGEMPDEVSDHDAYLITGSPAGVYETDPWIASLKDFLRDAKGKAKLVGICFGHQIMAEAFGGRVEKSDKGWGVGLHRYDIFEKAPWMDEVPAFSAAVSHQDQIVVQPPQSRVLAGSEFSPFGMLAYEDQPAISFQPHPEFDPEFAKALIETRRERIPEPDAAIASLDGHSDRERLAEWIRSFLKS
jgi:GMP synthase-like glutamine amidotransferase